MCLWTPFWTPEPRPQASDWRAWVPRGIEQGIQALTRVPLYRYTRHSNSPRLGGESFSVFLHTVAVGAKQMNRPLRLAALAGVLLFGSRVAMAQDAEVAEEASEAAPETAAESTSAPPDPIGDVLTTSDASSEYNRELLSLEEDVNTLKEQVFRSKATLQLLKEIVIQGRSTGSRAGVWHVNRLGPAYTLRSVSFYLDGRSIQIEAHRPQGVRRPEAIHMPPASA